MKKQHKNDWRHKKCKMIVHKKCEKDDDGDQKCRPTIMCVDTNQVEIAIQQLCTSN